MKFFELNRHLTRIHCYVPPNMKNLDGNKPTCVERNDLLVDHELHASSVKTYNQGDQIGRIFNWRLFTLGSFLKISEVVHIFELLFS
jgi:hypothetical protein